MQGLANKNGYIVFFFHHSNLHRTKLLPAKASEFNLNK
jgi:hypothetical protein